MLYQMEPFYGPEQLSSREERKKKERRINDVGGLPSAAAKQLHKNR